MMTTVEGIVRSGRIELLEKPSLEDGSRVLVTILRSTSSGDLAALGVSKEEAAEIRWRFGALAADWDLPEMDVYDEM